MVARHEWRRRTHAEGLFDRTAVEVTAPSGAGRSYAPRPDQQLSAVDREEGHLAVALFRGDDDDVYFVPEHIVVGRQVRARVERQLTDQGIAHEPIDDVGPVAVLRLQFPGGVYPDLRDAASKTLQVLADLQAPERLAFTAEADEVVAPLYGFVSHQTSQPCGDPEWIAALQAPTGDGGQGVTVHIIDTGAWSVGSGTTGAPPGCDPDPRWETRTEGRDLGPRRRGGRGVATGVINFPWNRYLGRAAGHGTFMRGLVQQAAPACTVRVTRAIRTNGLVDESMLKTKLEEAAQAGPDIIVLACGGAVFKRPGIDDNYVWQHPQVLAAAMAEVLRQLPGCIIVVSAGNDDSTDPCFPAAFAEFGATIPGFDHQRVVSVAALDSEGWRAWFSNYGTWVRASTIGQRLCSNFVQGREAPDNDPDLNPEDWTNDVDPWAVWSGTSFAAPIVAGVMARTLAVLRSRASGTTAEQAWNAMQALYTPGEDWGCGTVIPAGMIRRRGAAGTS